MGHGKKCRKSVGGKVLLVFTGGRRDCGLRISDLRLLIADC
jgi:hypothetical protein